MQRVLQSIGLALVWVASAAAQAKVDVNVGVTIREPGVYGRIEVGTAPPPPVYHPQPVVVQPVPVVVGQPVVVQQPMYLYVPPGHSRKWRKHCHRYNACGQPVYFVQEDWVRQSYQQTHPDWKPRPIPAHREPVMHSDRHHGKQHDRGHGRGHHHD